HLRRRFIRRTFLYHATYQVLNSSSQNHSKLSDHALLHITVIILIIRDEDGLFLISLNEKYAPIKVKENDDFKTFGRVLN
ncbi:MAG: S24 family peptidase, partial [Lachnospiraceae bacterium]|nr:S24 family peptidase [Lachnospiraceae bacterium]